MSEKGAGVGLEQGRRGAGLRALHSGRPAFTCSGFREPAGLPRHPSRDGEASARPLVPTEGSRSSRPVKGLPGHDLSVALQPLDHMTDRTVGLLFDCQGDGDGHLLSGGGSPAAVGEGAGGQRLPARAPSREISGVANGLQLPGWSLWQEAELIPGVLVIGPPRTTWSLVPVDGLSSCRPRSVPGLRAGRGRGAGEGLRTRVSSPPREGLPVSASSGPEWPPQEAERTQGPGHSREGTDRRRQEAGGVARAPGGWGVLAAPILAAPSAPPPRSLSARSAGAAPGPPSGSGLGPRAEGASLGIPSISARALGAPCQPPPTLQPSWDTWKQVNKLEQIPPRGAAEQTQGALPPSEALGLGQASVG
eukprot:XP_022267179.1 uncharacterized protein LOC111092898 [Canis lupus familiaris]